MNPKLDKRLTALALRIDPTATSKAKQNTVLADALPVTESAIRQWRQGESKPHAACVELIEGLEGKQ